MVLEKGLRIFGSSRSGVADFEKTVALYKSNPEIINYLSNIVGAVVPVRTIEDMKLSLIHICAGSLVFSLAHKKPPYLC